MARTLEPNKEAREAIEFIKECNLTPEQIAYRWTVKQIDKICFEIGLQPIKGEKQKEKTERLYANLFRTK